VAGSRIARAAAVRMDSRSLHPGSAAPRGGMTLVELLVVVAIVAALVALLLPAAQAAREASRRTTCVNNLRHIGCALHGHLLAKRQFPVGCTEWRIPNATAAVEKRKRNLAWSAWILPWLEARELTDRLDLTKPYDAPENALAAKTALPVFLCPSADRRGPLVNGFGGCDYGGLNGERIVTPNNPAKGVFVNDRGFGPREITDGLSKTFFVGECATGPWPDGQWINGHNLFDQAYAINWPTWEDEIRSRHPGGAHGLAGDGSVHLIRESTDLRVLAASITRSGGENLVSPWSAP
jgi:prepilin-type N-terminal cleavage/methylation domain-containing protein